MIDVRDEAMCGGAWTGNGVCGREGRGFYLRGSL